MTIVSGITWCRTAVDKFREMINRKDTKIKISYINWQEEFVCVFLADVTEPDKVHYVNEKLVKERVAVWCEEVIGQTCYKIDRAKNLLTHWKLSNVRRARLLNKSI